MKCRQPLFSGVFMALAIWIQAAPRRSNPIVSHMFTADPSAHVWKDGRLYVYPSTDTSPPDHYRTMDGYHVFSTDDMITWKDHGEILHSRDVAWGREGGGSMWAPDCAFKDGAYYLYFPHRNKESIWEIGVAVSTKPTSGFKSQGRIKGGYDFCDPCVFVDDDGQTYLYASANHACFAARLKDNMMETDGEMVLQTGLYGICEGPFVFKRNGKYYMIYPDTSPNFQKMRYAMSDSPLGPWDCKGVFVDHTDVITMHGSIVEYKGQWYLFYHNGSLSGGQAVNRSMCFDPVYFNEDGTLQMVDQTLGVQFPTFHQDINFNRMFGTLDVGNYTTEDLEKQGVEGDAISSFELPPGYAVDCFEENHFEGKSWRFEESVIDLSKLGCENTFSSIKVVRYPIANLLKNGSFEKGAQKTISNWDAGRGGIQGVARTLEPADHGYYVLCFEGDKAMKGQLAQSVAVSPGKTYKISASLKIDPDTAGRVVLDAEDQFFELNADTQAGKWVRFSGSVNSGPRQNISIRCGTSELFNGKCYWDSIAVVEQQ